VAVAFQIAKKTHLLLEESYSSQDANNVNLDLQRFRTNFGTKVTIHKPKIGSTLPK